MADIHDITDFVIVRMNEAGGSLSQLKLQKLLYYIQAWHLAIAKRPIVPAKFQAWVHGPVCREIFARFRGDKMLYSRMTTDDIRPDFDSDKALTKNERLFCEVILEEYGKYSADQLESLTHDEKPWIEARKGYKPDQRCEVEIDEKTMMDYYAAR